MAAINQLSVLDARNGRLDAALAALTERIDAGGKDKSGYVAQRANLLSEAGRTPEAIAQLDAEITEKPGDPSLLNSRCWIKGTGNVALDTALKDCTKAIELSEYPQNALDSRGMVYFRMGRMEDALADFNAALTYQETPDSPEKSYNLQVNKPLTVDGTKVHLLGHGYAPRVTVRDGQGQIAFSGPSPFLPQDTNFSSFGVVKAPDARPDQLGFEGFFLPTAVIDQNGPHSVFPDALNPALVLTAYYGRPAVETGKPESVYQLDKSQLTQFDNGKPMSVPGIRH